MIGRKAWWSWFGAGLVLAGVVTTGWTYFSSWSGSEPPELVTVALIAAAGLLIRLAVTLTTARRHGRALAVSDPSNAHHLEDEIFVAVGSARHVALIGAAMLAAVAVYGWTRVRRAFAGGLPQFAETGFTMSVTLVTAGLILLALAMRAVTTRPSTGEAAGLAGGVVVVGTAMLGVLAAVTVLPVDAGTVAAAGRPPAVPGSVSRVGWQWKSPDGLPLRDVDVTRTGVAARVTDGVVALDSRTGKELWHYRRPGARAKDVSVLPDGNTAVVSFEAEARSRGRAVLLHTGTGEVRAEFAPEWDPSSWRRLAYTSRSAITWHSRHGWAADPGLTGWDLDTSEAIWRYRLPEGCLFRDPYDRDAGTQAVMRDVFVLVALCAEGVEQDLERDSGWESAPGKFTAAVIGLDPGDGAEVWRHERELTTAPYRVGVRASDDLGSLAVIWGHSESKGDHEPGGGVLLDQATGKVITDDHPVLASGNLLRPPLTPFTSQGYLDAPHIHEADEAIFRWEPIMDGKARRASMPLSELDRSEEGDRTSVDLPVDEGVLKAYASWPSKTRMTVTALFTPWGTASTTRIPMELGYDAENPSPEHPLVLLRAPEYPLALLRAPGSIVVVSSASPIVTGLV